MLTGTIAPAPNAWMTRPKIKRIERGKRWIGAAPWNSLHHAQAIRAGQPGEAATSHDPTKKITRQTR